MTQIPILWVIWSLCMGSLRLPTGAIQHSTISSYHIYSVYLCLFIGWDFHHISDLLYLIFNLKHGRNPLQQYFPCRILTVLRVSLTNSDVSGQRPFSGAGSSLWPESPRVTIVDQFLTSALVGCTVKLALHCFSRYCSKENRELENIQVVKVTCFPNARVSLSLSPLAMDST